MNIELNIEELILHGFPAGDRKRIAEAVQNELARLMADHQDLPQTFNESMEIPYLRGESFAIRSGERPDSIGARIGQAVYAGMGKDLRSQE